MAGEEFLSSALGANFSGERKEEDRHRSHRSSRREDDEPRSHRHRSRSRERDHDRERRRRPEDDDRRSSRRHDDERPPRDDRRDRDRDDRRDRYDRREPDDRRDSGRDRRPPPRDYGGRDDRRDSGRGGGYGGGFGGGGRGGFDRDNRGGGRDEPPPKKRSATPEGTQPISKRKRPRTGWDVKPTGFEHVTALQAKMTGRFNLPGQSRPTLPMTYFNEGNMGGINQILNVGEPTVTFGSMEDNFPPGITYARQSRRLYVGGITDEGTDENISAFFNDKMREMGLAQDDKVDVQSEHPVVNVQINKEKQYAFVEFRSPEEASAAVSFDGVTFMGQVLKIRRPKDYLGAELMGSLHVPGIVSTNVPDSPEKIFIGGLPSYLTDDQVIELLKAFGELKAFNLVKEMGGQSKGFAFCEYVEPSVTDIACQGLNGMELGDRFLVVQRAAIGMGGRSNAGGGLGGAAPPTDFSTAVQKIAGTGSEANPTRVLQMLNMVTQEELVGDQDYQDILEDTRDECSNYGEVLEIRIPRPIRNDMGRIDQRASDKIPNLGKVFVMFDTVESAKKAMANIAGRQFDGRTVVCAYADESAIIAM